MKNRLLLIFTAVTLISFPNVNLAQTPDLGTVTASALFTGVGVFNNLGTYIVSRMVIKGSSEGIDTILSVKPLPIGLLSFNGNCTNQNIVLKWSTATEINKRYYSIERGTDGISWQLVGEVDGQGNSSTLRNYSFTDKEPDNDIFYYRLKQTDADGKYRYFNIIVVKNCIEDLTKSDIYPNAPR